LKARLASRRTDALLVEGCDYRNMSITFFFSAMSPYSWLSAERIGTLLPEAEWRPVFGGRVFEAHGRVSWGLTERRAAGMADCEARARSYGLGVMTWPDPWPSNGVLVARALIFAQRRGELRRFALTAMRMEFLEGLDLGALKALSAVARRAGFVAEDLAHAVSDPEIDAALQRRTDEAVKLGVSGVPTVCIGDVLFWGDDRLEEAAALASSTRARN
jgi:2-hydroxychromene-2-carboxylate isomerase